MTVRTLKLVLGLVTLAVWVGLIRLCVAFVNSELDWTAVATYSRRDAPWYYRLAAVWGGLPGSLWLFTGIVAAVALIAARRQTARIAVAYSIAVIVALGGVAIAFVSPFKRLDIPAIGGFGLTPILEHPAMAIHPPLLYLGLACTLPAFLGPEETDRIWLRRALALITLAMALGGLWSYLEQGWGGYWAWDPVENTSLMVWLAVIVALHARRSVATMAPWLLTLFGACIVRSGSTPSIHGFGQQATVGWSLLAVAGLSVLVAFVAHHKSNQPQAPQAAMNVRLTLIVLGVTVVGTLAPILVGIFSNRPSAVRGSFYSAFIGPVALLSLPFLGARLRAVGRPGWLAHLGAVVLIAGIAASTFDTTDNVIIAQGQSAQAGGFTITNVGLRIEPGPRAQSTSVIADLLVDGDPMAPSRVVYRDRGGTLNENVIRSRPWKDAQLQLDTAIDSGVITLTIYTRPMMWLVWLGAALISVGALTSRWRRPADPTVADPTAAAVCEPTNR